MRMSSFETMSASSKISPNRSCPLIVRQKSARSLIKCGSLRCFRDRNGDLIGVTEREKLRRQNSSPTSLTDPSSGITSSISTVSVSSLRAAAHRRKSSVTFRNVSVREYEVIASDNPSVKSGAAIELGWKYNMHDTQCIEEFEAQRAPHRKENFRSQQLDRGERESLLREFGFSDKEILEVTRRADVLRRNRLKSIAWQQYDQITELGESVSNALKWAKKKTSLIGSARSQSYVDELSRCERSHRKRLE